MRTPARRRYPLLWVDAFTSQPLQGNPCAVVLQTDDMPDTLMQAVAKEMNLSETAFVRSSSVADFGARYFTPTREIPFAGHPTIATAYALLDTGLLAMPTTRRAFSLEVKVGPIPVEVRADAVGVPEIVMTQRTPQFLRVYDPSVVASAFGLTTGQLMLEYPVQTVSTGTPQLMVLLRDRDALRQAHLHVAEYSRLHAHGDFFSPHLFCLEGFTSAGRTSARHLGLHPDTAEDPFTGSATGGMAAFLWHFGLLDRPTFVAEQGYWMDRPGRATVEVVGSRENIETVRVGGHGVVVMRGEMTL